MRGVTERLSIHGLKHTLESKEGTHSTSRGRKIWGRKESLRRSIQEKQGSQERAGSVKERVEGNFLFGL